MVVRSKCLNCKAEWDSRPTQVLEIKCPNCGSFNLSVLIIEGVKKPTPTLSVKRD